VTALIVDGVGYDIGIDNPVMAKLERVLGLLSSCEKPYYRHYGLRIWLMFPARPDRLHVYLHEITKSAVALLKVNLGEVNVQCVDSFAKAEIELRDLADNLLGKIRFPRPSE
jgi:hypothetical protein